MLFLFSFKEINTAFAETLEKLSHISHLNNILEEEIAFGFFFPEVWSNISLGVLFGFFSELQYFSNLYVSGFTLRWKHLIFLWESKIRW